MGLDDAALRRYGVPASSRWACCSRWSRPSCASSRRAWKKIFVIEGRPFLEMFAKQVLYGMANAAHRRQSSTRKKELLPHYGEFESDVIVRAR